MPLALITLPCSNVISSSPCHLFGLRQKCVLFSENLARMSHTRICKHFFQSSCKRQTTVVKLQAIINPCSWKYTTCMLRLSYGLIFELLVKFYLENFFQVNKLFTCLKRCPHHKICKAIELGLYLHARDCSMEINCCPVHQCNYWK